MPAQRRKALCLASLAIVAPMGEISAQQLATAQESLACFEQSRRMHKSHSECERGVVEVEAVVIYPAKYADMLGEVLDGLERLAASSDYGHVRGSAIVWLASAGTVGANAGGPVQGIVERLANVYRRTDEPGRRSTIASQVSRQQDTAAAVELLSEIALDQRDIGSAEEFPAAWEAVRLLAKMGPQGRAALQHLHAEGQVQNPIARLRLEHLAERGFQAETDSQRP